MPAPEITTSFTIRVVQQLSSAYCLPQLFTGFLWLQTPLISYFLLTTFLFKPLIVVGISNHLYTENETEATITGVTMTSIFLKCIGQPPHAKEGCTPETILTIHVAGVVQN